MERGNPEHVFLKFEVGGDRFNRYKRRILLDFLSRKKMLCTKKI